MLYDFGFILLSTALFFPVPPVVSSVLTSLLQKSPQKRAPLETNNNGSSFLWVPQDEFSGQSFFDNFTFFTDPDPTHGSVNYVNQSVAFQNRLAWIDSDGTVNMKADNETWLPDGAFRNSVRIESNTFYNTGLFILDLNRAPWGCGVWPAWWTLGKNGSNWPFDGEIDIIEGVHDNQHNQVAWHTGPGCWLDTSANFTGQAVHADSNNRWDCNGQLNDNAGCGITQWSSASYGPSFDDQGGGVFAMKWDENGIAIWSFYRASIPQDIIAGNPQPSTWAAPSAFLSPDACDPIRSFINHSMVFDITICGDWAGNSYATSGCQGTCNDVLKDPNSFINASWSINSLKVYRKVSFNGNISGDASRLTPLRTFSCWIWTLLIGLVVVSVSDFVY